MKSILDPSFKYVPSASTDVRRTFARIRREYKAEEERKRAAEIEKRAVVRELIARPR